MLAASGFVASPLFADMGEKKEVAEAAAADTVPAYIVAASGGGWGGAKKARAALTSLSGVENVMMSGMRATVFTAEGASLDEASVKAAIEGKKLKFISFEKTGLSKPTAAYQLVVSGATWAIENEKARVALEKLDGIAAAYVNNDITLHYSDDKFDEKLIASTIEPLKMKVKSSKKAELPF